MKRRFAVNSEGELEDRDGRVIGRLTSLTLEVPADVEMGGYRGGSCSEEKANDDISASATVDEGGVGETSGAWVEVWAHYAEVMKPRKRDLDPEGRKIIRDALKVATVVECCRAIDGCAASDHHMGRTLGARRKYNGLSQILKAKRGGGPYGRQGQTTRERIDFFLDLAEKAGLPSGVTSADPARVRSAKREVLDAWEYPSDESVVRRGEEAAAWLEQQGIQVLEDPSETNRLGRAKPRFEATAP